MNMLVDKMFTEKGVFPPELVGRDEGCFNYIMEYLRERNIVYRRTDTAARRFL